MFKLFLKGEPNVTITSEEAFWDWVADSKARFKRFMDVELRTITIERNVPLQKTR